jgi:hypothetical protein
MLLMYQFSYISLHVQFARTVSSYISQGAVLVALMTRVRWRKHSMISSTSNVYLSTAGEWSKMLANENITASGPPKTFEPGRESWSTLNSTYTTL